KSAILLTDSNSLSIIDVAPDLVEISQLRSSRSLFAAFFQDSRLVYKHFATLYFVFVFDSSENELAVLDLIQGVLESVITVVLPPNLGWVWMGDW
ncbi:hypothetical protein Gorai_009030, partial [Gossypium raimondii]|nr:hypothetical protein [Gossypium raimondii]